MFTLSLASQTTASKVSPMPKTLTDTPTRPTSVGSAEPESFLSRHLGPSAEECAEMLDFLGLNSLDELVDLAVPAAIRSQRPLALPKPLDEAAALRRLKEILSRNRVLRSWIGQGYYGTYVPGVIQRNILENPGWYTSYTPYQAEVAQGRLEALLNFQTMIMDLTGMEVANASLLDEATAAAEALNMCLDHHPTNGGAHCLVSDHLHPQTIAVLRTRAEPLGCEVKVGDPASFQPGPNTAAVILQYPGTHGQVEDWSGLITQAHAAGTKVVVATDLLALVLLRPPGEWGADIVVGSAQRFGQPLGFGGPHAAFLATRDALKRSMPGRLIGVSKDADGQPALRLSLQTREQHIRRDKATSNICTAQALLAILASMFAIYHGPSGLRVMAQRIHRLTNRAAAALTRAGLPPKNSSWFDTLTIPVGAGQADQILAKARDAGFNLRRVDDNTVGFSLDETSTEDELHLLLREAFGAHLDEVEAPRGLPSHLLRTTPILTHPVFNQYHTETELLRYIFRLQGKDISLAHSMIPLGSCTMKLNATAEMVPLSWPEVTDLHPFAPEDQAEGYHAMFHDLERWLGEITGLPAVSLQPNAGSQGEYAGLLAIRRYHQSLGQGQRNVCLIPTSAHGTNPASAVMAGLTVVPVACDAQGNIDLADLAGKCSAHADRVAALMITYPSTHGVFEETISEAARLVHQAGGQLYMDGANLNAQVGLCRPGEFGVDICHLNLHKTFCIPHGGGGPGVGPVAAAAHLAPFLPGHPLVDPGTEKGAGAVCAAPWGSASILVISWMFIAMLGAEGLKRCSQVAILAANYVARQLEPHYPILFKGKEGLVAHECILDLRKFKAIGIEVEDVAKRLMDYGFHAPTMSWPVPGTLMVEPTESESKTELDRFCDAMISIRQEIEAVAKGDADRTDNVLKGAPHTAACVCADVWSHAYGREQAAYPLPYLRQNKFWPPVRRVDNVYGDRNLVCSCLPVEAYRG